MPRTTKPVFVRIRTGGMTEDVYDVWARIQRAAFPVWPSRTRRWILRHADARGPACAWISRLCD